MKMILIETKRAGIWWIPKKCDRFIKKSQLEWICLQIPLCLAPFVVLGCCDKVCDGLSMLDIVGQFLNLGEKLKCTASLAGILVQPYGEANLSHFKGLPEAQKSAIIHHLEATVQTMIRMDRAGESLNDTVAVTLAVLRDQNLSVPHEIESHFLDDDSIIAYNRNHQMVYVSLNNFRLTSYSIEDLYCRKWMDLFRRHEMISKVLIERASGLVKGERVEPVFNSDIPPHSLIETQSHEKRAFICQPKLYAPLFLRDEHWGFIAVNRFKRTDLRLAEKMQRRS